MTGTLIDIFISIMGSTTWIKFEDNYRFIHECTKGAYDCVGDMKRSGVEWDKTIIKEARELIAFEPLKSMSISNENWQFAKDTFLYEVKSAIEHYYSVDFEKQSIQVRALFMCGRDIFPKPQQDTSEPQQGQITPEGNEQAPDTTPEPPQVPTINNTDRERWVYGSALKKDYMIKNENNTYKWKKDKVLLAYMCGRLYCDDRVISNGTQYVRGNKRLPNQELNTLFNISTKKGIGGNRDNIKEHDPPKDYNLINDIFKEVEKTG